MIKKGDTIGEIILPDSEGNNFQLSSTIGKKVLLTFYRHASCAICNWRINECIKRYDEFGNKFTMVGICHEPRDVLRKNMKKNKLHFMVLADE